MDIFLIVCIQNQYNSSKISCSYYQSLPKQSYQRFPNKMLVHATNGFEAPTQAVGDDTKR